MADFEYLNLEQLKGLKKQFEEYKAEFDSIVIKFGEINDTLLKDWEGFGANAYYDEVTHILDNLGNLDEALAVMEEIYQKIINIIDETDETLGAEMLKKGIAAGAEAGATMN